jgi:AraC-like DNA-binding protein
MVFFRLPYLWLHNRDAPQILLKDLVKNLDLGLNSSGISRLFSQFEGITFGAYLTKVRVEKARELLMGTHYPIAQIAQECQFHDASHFCRKFKSLTNLTPSQFRKECGKKIIT